MGNLSGWIWTMALLGGAMGLKSGVAPVELSRFEPALRLHLSQPQVLHRGVLSLSRGSAYGDPAAALTAYVEARGGLGAAGMPRLTESAWAFLNAGVTGELRRLDGLSFVLLAPRRPAGDDAEAITAGPSWFVGLPGDDGAIRDVALAVALTEGEIPRAGLRGSPLRFHRAGEMCAQEGPGGLVMASDARVIEVGRWLTRGDGLLAGGRGPGLELVIRPTRGVGVGSDGILQLLEAVCPNGMEELAAWLSLEGETARLDVRSQWVAGTLAEPPGLAVERDGAGEVQPGAAWHCALETTAAGRDAFFEMWDRLEKRDPARAKTAAIRTRLNLFLGSMGLHPEREIWPGIRETSGWLDVNQSGDLRGGRIAVRLAEERSVERLARVLERPGMMAGLLRSVGGSQGVPGPFSSRDVEIMREGTRLAVSWGTGRAAGRGLAVGGVIPAMELEQAGAGAEGWDRWLVVRPGAWVKRLGLDPSMAAGLAESGPIVWVGRSDGEVMEERITWGGLRGFVRETFAAIASVHKGRALQAVERSATVR